MYSLITFKTFFLLLFKTPLKITISAFLKLDENMISLNALLSDFVFLH